MLSPGCVGVPSLVSTGGADESSIGVVGAPVVGAVEVEDGWGCGVVGGGVTGGGVGFVVVPGPDVGAPVGPVTGAGCDVEGAGVEGVGVTVVDGVASGPGSAASPQAAAATSAETLPMSSHFVVEAKDERRNMTNYAVRRAPHFRPTIRARPLKWRRDREPFTTQRKSSGLDANPAGGVAISLQFVTGP